MLLVLFASYVHQVYSTPLPTLLTGPVDPLSVAEANNNNTRTLWSIIYTCLTTTLACTWISMHPNITQNKKWFTPLLMRLALSLYALFVPEAIVFWAATQWKAASDYERKYKDKYDGWSISHSFFLLMGGFTLPNKSTGEHEPVPAHRFDELLEEKRIYFPTVSRNDILDKSKGDPLAKGFVVLQTFWFVAQCLARFLQRGLVVTQLEVVTLALVPINVVIYFFWLKKPLSAKFAIPLVERNIESEKQTSSKNASTSNLGDTLPDSAVVCSPTTAKEPFGPIVSPEVASSNTLRNPGGLRSRMSTLLSTNPRSTQNDEDNLQRLTGESEDVVASPATAHSQPLTIEDNSEPPPGALRLAKKIFTGLILFLVLPALAVAVVAIALPPILFAAILVLVFAFVIVIPLTLLLPFLASMQIGAIGRHPEREAQSKLPMLYAPPISTRSTNLMLALTTICATIFGGMHLIAWSFTFPTPLEKLLWRISSIALTALPLMYFAYHMSHHVFDPYRSWLTRRHDEESDRGSGKRFLFSTLMGLDRLALAVVWSTLFLLGVPLYSLARLYVLVDAFIALRDPTPGALLAVDWIKFVPHF